MQRLVRQYSRAADRLIVPQKREPQATYASFCSWKRITHETSSLATALEQWFRI